MFSGIIPDNNAPLELFPCLIFKYCWPVGKYGFVLVLSTVKFPVIVWFQELEPPSDLFNWNPTVIDVLLVVPTSTVNVCENSL